MEREQLRERAARRDADDMGSRDTVGIEHADRVSH
jgi:hypothetical protein